MQRSVVHYDELTECGLFRNERGQAAYFRKGDAIYQQWMVGKPGAAAAGPAELTPPPLFVAPMVDVAPARNTSRPTTGGLTWLNWVGLGLTALALLLLINAGGDFRKTGMGRNPKLIDSIWGLGAAVLLLIELIYFSIGAPIRKIRTNYWGTVVCTVVAVFMLKSCDGYQADKVADVYTITLGVLLIVVYLIPKR